MKMHEIKKIMVGVITLATVLTLSACGDEGLKDPKAFYEESLKKVADVKSYESTASVKANVISTEDNKKMDISMDVSGKTDIKDSANIKSETTMKANVSGNITDTSKTENISGDLSIKVIGKDSYLSINSLTLPQEDPSMAMYTSLLAMVKGKWIKMSSDMMGGTDMTSLISDPKNNPFLVMSKVFAFKGYKGKNNGLHDIEVTLNPQGVISLVSEGNGATMTADETAEITKTLNDINFSTVLSIDDDKNIKAFIMNIKGSNLSGGVNLTLDISGKVDKYNEAFTITAPNASDVVDLNQMMGGMMGGMDTTMPTDDSMMDPSMMPTDNSMLDPSMMPTDNSMLDPSTKDTTTPAMTGSRIDN